MRLSLPAIGRHSSWRLKLTCDVEEPQVDCCSDEEDVDVFNTEGEADVEDLGKRKGINSARYEIVKKLKETPPNANTS